MKCDSPVIWRIGRMSTPSCFIGHQKNEIPRCLGASQSVRAMSMPKSAFLALEVHTFWPLTTHSSPSRSALVCSPARSDPAPGSEYSRHIPTSSRSSGRTNRSFSESVPNVSTVLAQRLWRSWPEPVAPTRRNSAATTVAVSASRPRPNQAVGHVGTAYPASTTRASHSLRGSSVGQCSSSQARTSWRSAEGEGCC